MTAPRGPVVGAVLSLTGRFARFGTQAARGLQAWSDLVGGIEILVEDDAGDRARVIPALKGLAQRCDVLLGPYSTVLMRDAAEFAAGADRILWNHGGSGDDVQNGAPGRVISVLTPTSGYAEPFVGHLAVDHEGLPLRLVEGRGSFARQVVAGAAAAARRAGVPILDHDGVDEPWALFSAGSFEEDTALMSTVLSSPHRPRVIGTVAAGVSEFADVVTDPDGVFGVAQWAPGSDRRDRVGPSEATFVRRYVDRTATMPDYPAVQAAATAALAVHCLGQVGSSCADDLWALATRLHTSTLFGDFGVDARTGSQRDHQMALVRWSGGSLRRA